MAGIMDGAPLVGNRRRLAGNRRRLEGNRRRLAGNRRRLAGNRRRLASNRRRLAGNRWRLAGNLERSVSSVRRRDFFSFLFFFCLSDGPGQCYVNTGSYVTRDPWVVTVARHSRTHLRRGAVCSTHHGSWGSDASLPKPLCTFV